MVIRLTSKLLLRRRLAAALSLIFLLGGLASAQNTCFTGSTGTTICSTSSGVIHGNTNSLGNSVYRDDRGRRLDFTTDSFGNASVDTASGEPVQWSQQVLGDKKYPASNQRPIDTRPHPASSHAPVPLESWLKGPGLQN